MIPSLLPVIIGRIGEITRSADNLAPDRELAAFYPGRTVDWIHISI